MTDSLEMLFADYRRCRSPALLGAVFDATAPDLFRIAAHLCAGDRARAEDALQATFLTAIEDAAAWDEARPLLPWLCGVLVNQVHRQRRPARRECDLDAITVPSDPAPQPPEAASAREWTDAMQRVVHELPRPYREAVALHLQHGLQAPQIAAALGRSPSAVRKQLERGLAQLRLRLPVGLVLGATAFVLQPAAANALRRQLLAASPDSSVADLGRAAIRSRRAVAAVPAIVALVVSIVAGALCWPETSPLAAASSTTDRAQPAVAASAAIESRGAEPPLEPNHRVSTAAPVPLPKDAIAVRVVDADGKPVAMQMVGCERDDEQRFAPTDENGRVVFGALPAPAVVQIYVVGTEVSTLVDDRGPEDYRSRDVTLQLARGVALQVMVRDAVGRPIAGASVESNLSGIGRRMWQPLGTTNVDGALLLTAVVASGAVRAFADGLAPESATIDAELGSRRTATIVLATPACSASVTVQAADGSPLGGAEVAVMPTAGALTNEPFFAIADRDGMAHFASLLQGPLVVTAWHRGCAVRGWITATHPGSGDLAVALQLQPGATVRGEVKNEEGTPRTWGCVRAELQHGLGVTAGPLPLLERQVRLDDRGQYGLDGLAPGRWRLIAADLTHDVELAAGATLQWDAQEPAKAPLLVRLVDEDRRPLPGWRVVLRNSAGYPFGDWLETNRDGEPEPDRAWRLRAGTEHGLELHAPRPCDADDPWDCFATMLVPPLRTGEPLQTIVVPARLRCSASVRGNVVTRDGTAPGRVRIELLCERSRGSTLDTHCDPATGAFAFAQLSPGRYWLAVAGQEREIEVSPAAELDVGAIAR